MKTFTCSNCWRVLPLREASKTYQRDGRRSYLRCRLCVCEASKYSMRRKKFAEFAIKVKDWPPEKLQNELGWLHAKVEVIERVLKEAGRR